VLGVVFDSTAMGAADTPEVQAGVVKLTMMIGGPHYTSGTVAVPADARSLIPAALAHLRTTLPDLPKALEPLAVYAQTHRDCIPTYTPGHGSRMRDIHESLGDGDWQGRLAVTGAGWGGVSLGDCTENGASLAERLLNENSAPVTGLERWKAWECVLLRPFAIPSERKLTSPGLFLFQRLYCPGPDRPLPPRILRPFHSSRSFRRARPDVRTYAISSPSTPRPQAPLAVRAAASALGFMLCAF
jgi:hypothetical protein